MLLVMLSYSSTKEDHLRYCCPVQGIGIRKNSYTTALYMFSSVVAFIALPLQLMCTCTSNSQLYYGVLCDSMTKNVVHFYIW